MFIKNTWYVAAWDKEVTKDGLFARTIIGTPLVMFRKEDDEIVVMEDRCCHRGAPLSMGRKEGDCVRCLYHGLKFDDAGKCIEAPAQARIPPQAKVKTFPVVQQHRWIWVWMGDPARADTSLIPDTRWLDHPDWRGLDGYIHYDVNYLFICDNLLDFSHLSYVHEKTLGGSTAIAQARQTIEAVPRGIKVTRKVANVAPPPYYRNLRDFDGNLDRWFIYDFLLPGTLLMNSGGRPVGDAEDDLRRAVRLHSCQTVTPETDSTTHYFFQQSRRVDDGDRSMSEALYRSLLTAFGEDRDMITAQARAIAADPEAPMLPLALDAAVVRFRRLVAEAIEAERAVAT
jgi:phenylpropionate dioxygenase-like ring-hydroxylating dioxygenase large terminal subunit